MVNSPWSIELLVRALRDRVLVDGAVTDGFTGLDVRPALPGEPPDASATEDHVVVVLRWRRDPCAYAIAFPLHPDEAGQDTPTGVGTALPVTSLEQWVDDIDLSLMEELDTGLVRRATRTPVGDVTVLTAGRAAGRVTPPGYCVGELHLGPGGGNGEHLAAAGLDVTTAQRLLDDGRVLTWRVAHVDNRWGAPHVGHAVVTRPPADGEGTWSGPARLEVLEVVPGTPGAVTAALAYQAVRDAVEAGAGSVSSALDDPALAEVGFRRLGDELSVTWRDVRTPGLDRSGPRSAS